MNITILAVGTVKEPFYAQAVAEYCKRLRPYATLRIVEVPEQPRPEKASAKEIEQALEKEAERILKVLPKQSCIVSLCIEGKQQDSVSFATQLDRWAVEGGSAITFLIGGSDGLAPKIKALGKQLSFSRMTFPHTLMRVILLEQIYRGFRILHHEPYHK
ncbi:23S rRNA (pseudouridine(1915)-N(3))-methyltransferase RlmH [Murdochiella vaginalis]|uniref:23S rRNA (pseudouridine(1915)-N(3))-methyltransferase RlmH n=1 Tax=Murdochiella vaginalis TaxID=1852373 RepID=UPI0008FDD087|nr:23S rRNA (pseudouridine(1915)-N(3))-methyltransferase RlmH [Murdochiella vaginalis]